MARSKAKPKINTEQVLAKTLRKAKTVEEMLEAFGAALPGMDEETVKDVLKRNRASFSVFVERKPHMWEEYAHEPFYHMVDRGVLDPKTRELVSAGIMMALHRRGGAIFHMLSALCNGATEEEIMEVAFLTCYVLPKIQMSATNDILAEGFRIASKMKKK